MTKVEVGRSSSLWSRLGSVRSVGLGGPWRRERRVLLREMWARREVRLAWKGARTSLMAAASVGAAAALLLCRWLLWGASILREIFAKRERREKRLGTGYGTESPNSFTLLQNGKESMSLNTITMLKDFN